MTDNVEYLPIWKKDATAEEWFGELAMMARKNPAQFGKVVICAIEDVSGSKFKVHVFRRNVDTFETIGLLDAGKSWFWDQTYK